MNREVARVRMRNGMPYARVRERHAVIEVAQTEARTKMARLRFLRLQCYCGRA
jgi:hypothetical protein